MKMETRRWNIGAMEVAYTVFGWTAFATWACSFYPQLLLNFSRKSVVGLSLNFLLLNNTKHILYFIYNTSLFFSPDVRFQYYQKFGFDQMIPVAANDVALSTHAVVLTSMLLVQSAVYQRGNQSISKVVIAILLAVWLIAALCFFIAFPSKSWLWLISIFNTMQVILAVIKYSPQGIMNFINKSTQGFSISYVLLDLCGGLANVAQMLTQSIDQNSWANFSGNIGKVLLCLIAISFDVLFMFQHYVLYPPSNSAMAPPNKFTHAITKPLINSPHYPLPPTV
ncbi:cystinosin-like protein [Senna tora]|uniref:Cystinosin homolog n=1 Tax=Senna tora TaxID=362788 RepID=A0A834TC50_9FABA|nr:cystinosin-like protein [Senna tora]